MKCKDVKIEAVYGHIGFTRCCNHHGKIILLCRTVYSKKGASLKGSLVHYYCSDIIY